MTLLVTGAGGQLGRELLVLAPEAVGLDHRGLDITDEAAVRATLGSLGGDLTVINTAAWTRVDDAEADPVGAWAANARGPAVLAGECARLGVRLLHLSTDYVFPGTAPARSPGYEPDDAVGPRSVYGASKLAGELAVRAAHPQRSWVVRTAWVYAASGANFVTTMLRLERERAFLEVVDDQVGSPTYAADLAAALLAMLAADPAPGIYHAAGGGSVSWHGLAQAVFAELGADPARVRPVASSAVPRPAPRPAFSVLGPRHWTAAGLTPLRGWREALAAAMCACRGAAMVAGGTGTLPAGRGGLPERQR